MLSGTMKTHVQCINRGKDKEFDPTTKEPDATTVSSAGGLNPLSGFGTLGICYDANCGL